MNFNDINPHIRYAEQIKYHSSGNTVMVRDCRIFYILSGSGEITIENHSYTLMPDSLFFCRENSVYSIVSDGISLLVLNFDLTQKNSEQTECLSIIPLDNAKTLSFSEPENITDCNFINSHIYIENGKKFLDSIKDIISEHRLRKIYFREKSSGILKDLLAELVRSQTLSAENSNKAVAYAIDYINDNFEKNIVNKDLAKLIGYHEYHLNRLFLKHTGQSIHQYILTRRLNESKKLLFGSDLPLSEIAERTGFNSGTYFSYYFKQVNGITPFQYRQMCRNGI